jgi:hypothetical protein
LNTKKTTDSVGHSGHVLGQALKDGGVKSVNRIPTLSVHTQNQNTLSSFLWIRSAKNFNSKFKTYNELCSKAVCARQGKNNFPLGLLEAQMPLIHRFTS